MYHRQNWGEIDGLSVGVYTQENILTSPYECDDFEEAMKVAEFVLHGLKEKVDDPDLERLKREIASGERDWLEDADDVRKAGPMIICIEHKDGDSKVQLVFKDPEFWESEEGSDSLDGFELGEYE